MTKQDKRVAITKETIEVAYLDVLAQSPRDKVTVKDVCDRAGVNRTTFYKYYKNAEDLGQTVRRNLLNYIEMLLQESVPEDHSDVYEFTSRLIMSISRDSRLQKLPLLFQESAFRLQAEDLIQKYYYTPRFGPRISDEQRIQITFCHYGFMGLVDTWVKDGFSLSPEQMANSLNSFSRAVKRGR